VALLHCTRQEHQIEEGPSDNSPVCAGFTPAKATIDGIMQRHQGGTARMNISGIGSRQQQ
jgi:hypothetical protein